MKTARQLVHDALRHAGSMTCHVAVSDAGHYHSSPCNELTSAIEFDRLLRKNERELADYAAALTQS